MSESLTPNSEANQSAEVSSPKNSELKKPKANDKFKLFAIIAGSLLAVLVVVGIVTYSRVSNLVKEYNDVVYPGVVVNGIDLSHKTKEEAKVLLQGNLNDVMGKTIKITMDGKDYSLKFDSLNISANVDETLNQAFNYGKTGSVFQKYNAIKKPVGQTYTTTLSYEDANINTLIDKIASENETEPVNAKINITGSSLDITDEVNGQIVDKDDLKSQITSAMNTNLEIQPVIAPKTVAKNASVSKEMLAKIDTVISSFSTDYGSSNSARAKNVSLGAAAINGTLLMPGDTFSFNGTVGDTSPDKGYQQAGVYVGNKLEQGYGGGICQVSTTLYNTVIRANIASVERRNHSMPVAYVPLGQDATIAFGFIDYKFKNTKDYPIYIQTSATDGTLTMKVWSNSAAKDSYTYSLSQEEYATQYYDVQRVNDPTMPVGKEVVDTPGSTMHKVRTYLVAKDSNGNVISKNEISDDTYDLVNQIVKVGTKTETPATNTANTNNTPPATNNTSTGVTLN